MSGSYKDTDATDYLDLESAHQFNELVEKAVRVLFVSTVKVGSNEEGPFDHAGFFAGIKHRLRKQFLEGSKVFTSCFKN